MRSAEAHSMLAEHDDGLAALPLLLDDAALSERLGVATTRSYLRYKPGTSAIALVDVGGRPAIASAWSHGAGHKRAKAVKHAAPDDVLLDQPERGLLVVDAMTDRRLPALRLLLRSGRVGPWLGDAGIPVDPQAQPTTLSHKPARRWVGSLPLAGERSDGDVVLRAHTPRGHEAALAGHALVDPSRCPSVRLPHVLATHRRGLIALEHLRGRTLDATVGASALRRLGACLGELHASGPGAVAEVDRTTVGDGLGMIAAALGDVAVAAGEVEEAARAALRPGPGCVIHGDFSLDQVVADGHALGIIDLDRVRPGNPLDDLASLLAAAALSRLPAAGARGAAALVERLRGPFVAGHASTWRGPLGDDLGPRTALALLSRAGEPFRAGRADWPDVTRELVTLAGDLAAEQVAA